MERENGKGVLFGVLGIMTLIIAILGASLAYFTATDRSEEDAVTVQAATVSITYSQGTNLLANDLIPSTFAIAQKAYNGELYETEGEQPTPVQCKDAKGKTVCSVFRFSVTNDATAETDIEGKIISTLQEFSNLRYVVYSGTQIDEETGKLTNGSIITGTNLEGDEPGTLFAETGSNSSLFPQTTLTVGADSKTYFEVLIWLNEEPDDTETPEDEGNQDDEQGASYTGTVEVSVTGQSDKITGSDRTE